jgi:hypothetical protein
MIFKTVRDECVRFGGHVDIQVSYKILWLEVPKEASIYAQSTLFLRGAILRQIWTQHHH